jgi:hypothetical protein
MAGEVDAVVWRMSRFDEQTVLTLNGKVARVGFDRDERSVITIHRTTEARTIAVRARAWDLESGLERAERAVDPVADAFTLTPTGDLVLAKDEARGSGRGGSVVVEGGAKMELRYEGTWKEFW